ncbi:hypothetical protein NMY22_g9424 [Coprinellus aureogranulatus]|nr:hypothetical protein NMY22_g9424 [Coprinellus aureogranulatus]
MWVPLGIISAYSDGSLSLHAIVPCCGAYLAFALPWRAAVASHPTQMCLGLVSALSAMYDGEVSDDELESAETQATTNLILAFAILLSCIVQALTGGLTSYHTSIVLSLSWMNNTTVFIYFLLYVQYKGQPGDSRIEPRWSAWAAHFRNQIRTLKTVFQDTAEPDMYTDRWTVGSGPNPDWDANDEKREIDFKARKVARVLFQRVSLVMGSLHLTAMAVLGTWLWSDLRGFGGSEGASCATESAFVAILGHSVPFGSNALRIMSLVIYALFLLPGINLLLPVVLFLSVYFWHHARRAKVREEADQDAQHGDTSHRAATSRLQVLGRRLKSIYRRAMRSRVLPVYIGLTLLFAVNIVFLVDIELTLRRNEHLQDGQSEGAWGFGQILAMLMLSIPLRDLMETILARRSRRHEMALSKERLNLTFAEALHDRDCRKIVELVVQGADPNYKPSGSSICLPIMSTLLTTIDNSQVRKAILDRAMPTDSLTLDGITALEVVTPNINLASRTPGDDRPSVLDWDRVPPLIRAGADVNILFTSTLEPLIFVNSCTTHRILPADSDLEFRTVLQAACGLGVVFETYRDSSDSPPSSPLNNLLKPYTGMRTFDVVTFLLEKGADPNLMVDGHYGTALIAACKHGVQNRQAVEILLDHGVDVNVQGSIGFHHTWGWNVPGWPLQPLSKIPSEPSKRLTTGTALRLACDENHVEIAKLLLDRGADLTIVSGKFPERIMHAD